MFAYDAPDVAQDYLVKVLNKPEEAGGYKSSSRRRGAKLEELKKEEKVDK